MSGTFTSGEASDRGLYWSLAIAGALVWLTISLGTGKKEAWDSAAYFLLGLPAMGLLSGYAGFSQPTRVWRWGVVIVAPQPLTLILMDPIGLMGASLLPLGLIAFAILTIPCIVAAYIGAALRRKMLTKKSA